MHEKVYRSLIKVENRRHPRTKLKLLVQYQRMRKGEVTGPHSAQAEDLGARGIAMRSATPMRLGQLLMVTLFLPPENLRNEAEKGQAVPEEDCQPVAVLSRVAWCAPYSEEEFMLGVEFLDADPAHRNRLKTFLVDYHLDQPDSALYM